LTPCKAIYSMRRIAEALRQFSGRSSIVRLRPKCQSLVACHSWAQRRCFLTPSLAQRAPLITESLNIHQNKFTVEDPFIPLTTAGVRGSLNALRTGDRKATSITTQDASSTSEATSDLLTTNGAGAEPIGKSHCDLCSAKHTLQARSWDGNSKMDPVCAKPKTLDEGGTNMIESFIVPQQRNVTVSRLYRQTDSSLDVENRKKHSIFNEKRSYQAPGPRIIPPSPAASHQRIPSITKPWQMQKAALFKKFGSIGWSPRKRLSPDALEGIRALHAQHPSKCTTPIIANHFKISPEAVRRILKSKWRPSEEEEERRRQRWNRRGATIWSQMAEVGAKPPKKWRQIGIKKFRVITPTTYRSQLHTPGQRIEDNVRPNYSGRRVETFPKDWPISDRL